MTVKRINDWAIPYVKNFRTYIDIGAHNGDTSIPFIGYFKHICAFEPNPQTNIHIPKPIEVHDCALGNKETEVVLIIPDNNKNDPRHGSTARFTEGSRKYLVQQKTLDSFNFNNVDFIKIDVEGSELSVLQGSVETIKRCKPVIMFESKNKTEAQRVLDFFADLSYNIKKYKGETIAYYE